MRFYVEHQRSVSRSVGADSPTHCKVAGKVADLDQEALGGADCGRGGHRASCKVYPYDLSRLALCLSVGHFNAQKRTGEGEGEVLDHVGDDQAYEQHLSRRIQLQERFHVSSGHNAPRMVY